MDDHSLVNFLILKPKIARWPHRAIAAVLFAFGLLNP